MLEAALVLPVALLFILGILEYGRYFLVRNLIADAAREGARYAVVHTVDKTTADVQNTVLNYLGSQDTQLQGLTIQVYSTDANGNAIAGSDWTTTAFGSGIGVQVDGDYQPVVPAFLLLPKTTHLTAISIMTSEGH